jgi:hypothetical protein
MERFNYPDNHIEIDNRLSWHLGFLNEKFHDDAFYIHLIRNRDLVAKSHSHRFYQPASIMDAFSGLKMIPPEKLSSAERIQLSYDYVDTVNANIALFLRDKTRKMNLQVENIQEDFQKFWKLIGAQGNLEKALSEFSTRHNESGRRRLNLFYRYKLLLRREYLHFSAVLHSCVRNFKQD